MSTILANYLCEVPFDVTVEKEKQKQKKTYNNL